MVKLAGHYGCKRADAKMCSKSDAVTFMKKVRHNYKFEM